MNFIPIEIYIKFFFYICLVFILLTYINCNSNALDSKKNQNTIKFLGITLFAFVLIYIGFRPVSGKFGDMVIYNNHFKDLIFGEKPEYVKDPLFEFMMYGFSKLGNSALFFFFCSFLYIVPTYVISKRLFKEYWYYSFLFLVCSFSFWGYGTNGIRNGIATSLFLLAISEKNNFIKIIFFLCSAAIHRSLIIVVIAFFITSFYKKEKHYFYIWLFAIPFSFVVGTALAGFFTSLGFGQDDEIMAYFNEFDQEMEGETIKVGFRWDFILYSASAVYAAWYYIFKKNYKDKFYSQFVSIYLIVNALWILIIRANYSNRFAYLSWFMIGIIVIYPLLKVKFYQDQNKVIGKILLLYFAFTFLMNVIIYD